MMLLENLPNAEFIDQVMQAEAAFPAPLDTLFVLDNYSAKEMVIDSDRWRNLTMGRKDYLPLPITKDGLDAFLTRDEIIQYNTIYDKLVARAKGHIRPIPMREQKLLLSVWWGRFATTFSNITKIPLYVLKRNPHIVFALPSYRYNKARMPYEAMTFPSRFCAKDGEVFGTWYQAADISDKKALEIFLGGDVLEFSTYPRYASVRPWDVFNVGRLPMPELSGEGQRWEFYAGGSYHNLFVKVKYKDAYGNFYISQKDMAEFVGADATKARPLRDAMWTPFKSRGSLNFIEGFKFALTNFKNLPYTAPPRFAVTQHHPILTKELYTPEKADVLEVMRVMQLRTRRDILLGLNIPDMNKAEIARMCTSVEKLYGIQHVPKKIVIELGATMHIVLKPSDNFYAYGIKLVRNKGRETVYKSRLPKWCRLLAFVVHCFMQERF